MVDELRGQHDGQCHEEDDGRQGVHLNRNSTLSGTPDIDREGDQRAGIEEADDEVIE